MQKLIIGDVFNVMDKMEDHSVNLVLTSPPFLALRSYLPPDHPDKDKEIGTEPSPAEYIDTLLALTAVWGRLLTEDGSLVVELGDTYSGSGGAGGDYNDGGLRDGQNRFDGSASRAYGTGAAPRPPRRAPKKRTDRPNGCTTDGAEDARMANQGGPGWPLHKSLVGIPHLYHLSLVYGVNILTGAPSPAGQWRVRNVVAWCRPNPPVGRLADKVRPATSYLTIACLSKKRYFDLDAVRTPTKDPSKPGARSRMGNPAGAPPLDHWWEDEFEQDAWLIPTAPYKGAHYATWPPRLLDKPILAMCPPGGVVLDPFAGSGTTLMVAESHGRNGIGIDLDERNVELAQARVGAELIVERFL